MEDFINFLTKYRGAILGGLIALIALILRLHIVLFWIIIVIAGIFIGNYIQNNKDLVIDKIKYYIDKF